MNRQLLSKLVALTIVLAAVPHALGQASTSTISLQGKLTSVADGPHAITVRFYDAATGGTVIQSVPVAGVNVTGGVFSAGVPVSETTFNGASRWWTVSVDGGAETQRTLVTSVPYATSVVGGTVRASTVFAGPTGPGIATMGVYQQNGSGQYTTPFSVTGDGFLKAVGLMATGQPDNNYPSLEVINSSGTSTFSVTGNGAIESRVLHLGGVAGQVQRMLVDANFSGILDDYAANFRVFDGGIPGTIGLAVNYKTAGLAFDVLRVYNNGPSNAVFRVTNNGTTITKVLQITGADVAEPFNIANSDNLPAAVPGMVVSIDPANPGKVMVCSTPYDKKVAGAISGAGGLSVGVVMGKDNSDPLIAGDHPVAMSGRVYVWCDAASGAIKPGDRLTTSSTPGHAMKAVDAAQWDGAVIGKAMTGLKDGKGLVLVLVNLQ